MVLKFASSPVPQLIHANSLCLQVTAGLYSPICAVPVQTPAERGSGYTSSLALALFPPGGDGLGHVGELLQQLLACTANSPHIAIRVGGSFNPIRAVRSPLDTYLWTGKSGCVRQCRSNENETLHGAWHAATSIPSMRGRDTRTAQYARYSALAQT
jgi:hypothetical protein